MSSKVIETSPDYVLQLGTSLDPETKGRACYQVINTVYDVVEVEVFLLPQAYEYLEQLQAGVDAKRQILAELKASNDARKVDRPEFNH